MKAKKYIAVLAVGLMAPLLTSCEDFMRWLFREDNAVEQEVVHISSIDIKAEGLVNGEVSLNKGKTLQLTAVISPKNAVEKDVWWTSDDSNIATVSSKGLVNAVKAGDVNITVQSLNNPLIQAFVIVHVFDGDVDINNNPVDQVTAD